MTKPVFRILPGLIITALSAGATLAPGTLAAATSLQDNLAQIKKQALAENKNFTGFSPDRGRVFFSGRHTGGKPETPSCTACHTGNPAKSGQSRAGKTIAPMALSKTPDRYSDPKKLAKWFRRNCKSVLGRVCTAQEKGDFLSFMASQ